MRALVFFLTTFTVLSRLQIANQPTLGVRGLLGAARRSDIVALTPAIIHLEHIAVGILFGIGFGLLYEAKYSQYPKAARARGWACVGLAVALSLFEVGVFFARGG
jgi:hypothetical protein